jgi:hypothetical protein
VLDLGGLFFLALFSSGLNNTGRLRLQSATSAISLLVINRIIYVSFGMLLCWLLNMVQLGIAFVLLSSSEKLLPAVYTMSAALGLVQIGYVVPLWRYLRRNGRRDVAMGVIIAAVITICVNFGVDYHLFGSKMFRP